MNTFFFTGDRSDPEGYFQGHEPVYKTCTKCRKTYTKAAWDACLLLGRMDFAEDGDGRLTLKNCACDGTMAVLDDGTPHATST